MGPTNLDWPGGVDRMEPMALETVDLPAATKVVLRAGLPREVRLPGWLGPTVFSSEIGSGSLEKLAGFAPALERHALSGALVVGSVRETQSEPHAYAAFCLRQPSGEVWIVDTGAPNAARFVNFGLDPFLRSLRLLVSAWPAKGAKQFPANRNLQEELEQLDRKAFARADNYWPTWLETEFAPLTSTMTLGGRK
jgi:hypothetical protein